MLHSVFLILWALLLFLFTCTVNMEQFLFEGVLAFHISLQPNFSEFWYPLPSTPEVTFISRKVGHAVSFFIFALLTYFHFLSKKKMLFISVFYSALTEVLQLFFNRGGRLFDIGFDGIGIVIAFLVVTKWSFEHEKSLTNHRQT